MRNFTYLVRATVLCILLAAGATASAQQVQKSFVMSTGEKIGFHEFTPADYATEDNVKHPFILFLHGIGERGNGTTDLWKVARIGLPQMLRDGFKAKITWNGKTETFIVLSPQCPSNYGMWPTALVNDILEYAKKNYRIDTSRMYLTGLSMGGGGSFRYISNHTTFPAKLAATATICAPCTFSDGAPTAKAKLPVWAFHAADDAVALASCTEKAINMINAQNPEVKPLKTIWPTGGHEVWDRVYKDTNYRYDNVINIYEWFLGQNKSLPVNKMPVARVGADMKVSPRQTSITLDASASTDVDGKIVRYVWKKISGPAVGTLNNKMSANPTTTVTGLTIAGIYKFELAVVDDRAGFTRDTLSITVAADAPLPVDTVVTQPKPVDTVVTQPKPVDTVVTQPKPVDTVVTQPKPVDTVVTQPKPVDTVVTQPKPIDTVVTQPKPTVNKAPVARTTGDIMIPSEWNWAPNISAYPSTDEDGYVARVAWQKISGPKSCNIASPGSVKTNLLNLVPGVYVFRATVYDNKGASSYADVKVSITIKGQIPVDSLGNKAPVARTTADIVVPIEWNWAPNVSASPSTDEDGYIASVSWQKISGPDSYKIESPYTIRTTLSNLVPGEYVFRATVYDNKGASSYDDVKVTITKKTTTTVASSAVVAEEEVAVAKAPVTVLSMPSQVTLSPNPAINMVNIQYTSNATGKSAIKVYDMSGRVIKSIPFNKADGAYRHNLDISQLTSGVYYVQVQTGNTVELQSKFVKK